MLWKLKPGGHAGIVLANGSMSSELEIRKAMIRGDVVEVMVSLPGKLFLNTPISCCLWFLTNDKTKNGRDRRKETLFIDGRDLGYMKTRALKILTDEDIKKIQDTVFLWREGKKYNDIEGFCKSSSTMDI
jgi:type I restriction enzyme M protein